MGEGAGPRASARRSSAPHLANALDAQGNYAEAECRAALAAFRDALGSDHPHVALSQLNLSQILSAQGETQEALPLLESAWALHERAPLPDEQAADTAFALAEALWATRGDRARALDLAQRSVELYRKLETPAFEARQKVEQWLRIRHEGRAVGETSRMVHQ